MHRELTSITNECRRHSFENIMADNFTLEVWKGFNIHYTSQRGVLILFVNSLTINAVFLNVSSEFYKA